MSNSWILKTENGSSCARPAETTVIKVSLSLLIACLILNNRVAHEVETWSNRCRTFHRVWHLLRHAWKTNCASSSPAVRYKWVSLKTMLECIKKKITSQRTYIIVKLTLLNWWDVRLAHALRNFISVTGHHQHLLRMPCSRVHVKFWTGRIFGGFFVRIYNVKHVAFSPVFKGLSVTSFEQ